LKSAANKRFDTSGKSPAYLHRRKIFKARAGKPVAGFFNPALRIGRRPQYAAPHPPYALLHRAASEPPSEPSSAFAGTRERVGTRRG
jgi:hypothetical protein